MKRLMSLQLFLCLVCPVVVCADDGSPFFMYADFWCAMYSRDQAQVEYLVDWFFNKDYLMQYNSTVGSWTGLTPAGLITAAMANGESDLLQRKMEKQLICVNNIGLIFNMTEKIRAEPSVTLTHTSSSTHNFLVCSAYDFYPKFIKVTWRRNGQEVTSGVSWSGVMSNGDWTYQVHSYLDYTPGSEDGISCVVEHATLKEPQIYEWEAAEDQSEERFLIAGFCALLLGAGVLSVGLIKYKRRHCNPSVL